MKQAMTSSCSLAFLFVCVVFFCVACQGSNWNSKRNSSMALFLLCNESDTILEFALSEKLSLNADSTAFIIPTNLDTTVYCAFYVSSKTQLQVDCRDCDLDKLIVVGDRVKQSVHPSECLAYVFEMQDSRLHSDWVPCAVGDNNLIYSLQRVQPHDTALNGAKISYYQPSNPLFHAKKMKAK